MYVYDTTHIFFSLPCNHIQMVDNSYIQCILRYEDVERFFVLLCILDSYENIHDNLLIILFQTSLRHRRELLTNRSVCVLEIYLKEWGAGSQSPVRYKRGVYRQGIKYSSCHKERRLTLKVSLCFIILQPWNHSSVPYIPSMESHIPVHISMETMVNFMLSLCFRYYHQ